MACPCVISFGFIDRSIAGIRGAALSGRYSRGCYTRQPHSLVVPHTIPERFTGDKQISHLLVSLQYLFSENKILFSLSVYICTRFRQKRFYSEIKDFHSVPIH